LSLRSHSEACALKPLTGTKFSDNHRLFMDHLWGCF
jgi:hypothetical protein